VTDDQFKYLVDHGPVIIRELSQAALALIIGILSWMSVNRAKKVNAAIDDSNKTNETIIRMVDRGNKKVDVVHAMVDGTSSLLAKQKETLAEQVKAASLVASESAIAGTLEASKATIAATLAAVESNREEIAAKDKEIEDLRHQLATPPHESAPESPPKIP
jgi:hypothetical protein